MKKIYFIKGNKYRKFKNPKRSYISNKILVIFIICNKCDSNDENTFKDKESVEILKILASINKTNE